jgi:SMI1-KNR4 cell-wall
MMGTKLIDTISGVVNELNKFSKELVSIGGKIEDNRISEFETEFNVQFPGDYKLFLSVANGFSLLGTEVYGIYAKKETPFSLRELYIIEHYEVQTPQPKYLLPFSPDGGGNFYCFDTRILQNNSCPVVFWVSNYPYTDQDVPEIVNESFVEWMNEIVFQGTLEDYDYDGSLR